jgi:hypothetical protein
VRHIPGRLNVLVDSLSRSLAPVNTEWELHQAVFQSIVLHWRNPNIDLFATSLNCKVTTFVFPVPDPRAYAVDLEMCLVAVSEKSFCLRLSLTETKRVDGVFLEKDELHPL